MQRLLEVGSMSSSACRVFNCGAPSVPPRANVGVPLGGQFHAIGFFYVPIGPDLPDPPVTLGELTRTNRIGEPRPCGRRRNAVWCGRWDARTEGQGLKTRRVLLIGGAARSLAVQEIASSTFGAPVPLPAPLEYVAIGAARQAAWALSSRDGRPDQPHWTSEAPIVRGRFSPGSGSGRPTASSARPSTHGADSIHPCACRAIRTRRAWTWDDAGDAT